MELSPAELSSSSAYQLLTSAIVPRFIAWVATGTFGETTNLAPFSYATIASHAPLSLLFVIAGRKPDGERKDTLRNVQATDGGTGEFVVHVVDESLAAIMAKSAASLAFGQSEIDELGLQVTRGSHVAAPRLVGAKVAFECRTSQIVPVGVSSVVIGEVVAIHVADDIMEAPYGIDPAKLAAVGRMGGSSYVRTRDCFALDDARVVRREKKRL